MVAGKSPTGWLPPGWKEQVKFINGRKVKCYIEPLTGSKFYTKPQVAKYLKSKKPSMGEFFGGEASLKPEASCNMKTMEGASCASEQKERGVSKKSIKEVVIERTIPDGLPTGWIKETKIVKRNGTRKDPYYTDPVSGYVFRSVPDALRHLESGDVNECAIKPRKRHELSFLVEETSVKSPSSANIQHSRHHTSKAQLEGMENSVTIKGSEERQCPTVSSDATLLSTAEHPLNHVIEECAETECSDNPSGSNQQRTEGSKREICDRVDEKNGTDKFAMNVESNIDRKMLIDSRKTGKQESVNLQRRSSKRLRGTEPEMGVSLGLSERELKAAARNAEVKLFQVSDRLNEKKGADQFAVNVIGSSSDHKMLTTSKAQLEGMENSVTIKGSEERQCPTVSSDATLLSTAEHPLNHVIEECAETECSDNPSGSNQQRTEGSKREICDRVDEKNGTDKFAMNVESNIDRKMLIDSRKTGKQESVNLQRRSSKRLRGTEPEMGVSLGLSERELKAAARNAEVKLFQVSDRLNEKKGADQFAVNVIGSSSDRKMLTTSKAQLEGMENSVTIKSSEERQCPTVSSDATLLSTAEHPLNHVIEECAETECSDNPSGSNQQRTEGSKREICDRVDEKNGTDKFAMNVESNIDRKMLIDSRKTGKQESVNLQRRSSKRLRGTEPEMGVSLGLSERELKAAARNAEVKLFQVSDRLNEKKGADQFAVNVIGSSSDHKMLTTSKAQLEGMENSVTIKGSEERQCPTVSSDATLLSTAEHPLNHVIEECAETECSDNPSGSNQQRTEGSKRKICDRVDEKNGTDIFAMNVESNIDRKMLIGSRKTGKQESVNLQRRSSKRLRGTEPEMVVSLGLSERELKAAARNAEVKLFQVSDRLNEKKGADQFAVNVIGSSSDHKMLIKFGKTVKQEAVNQPLRSSKRLMGIKPELVVSLGLSERDIVAAARNAGAKLFRFCDTVDEKNGSDQFAVNVVGSISDRKMLINSTKMEKQEAVNLPLRSSKRLMGTKPEMDVDLGLSERDLIAAAKNAEENLLVRGAPQLLETFSRAEIANHFLTGTDSKLSNGGNKPLKNEDISEARQGTEEEHEADVESKILNPVGDFGSDPCLDFAVKILTGTIQIEEETKETNDPSSSPMTRIDGCNGNQCDMLCAENVTVSFPSADMVPEGKLAESRMGMKKSRKVQINSSKSNKEAVSLPHRYSNQLAGLNHDVAVKYPLCQRVPVNAKYGESPGAKQSPEALDNAAPVNAKYGESPGAKQSSEALDNAAHSAPLLFETIEGRKEPMAEQDVQGEQPVWQETETKNVEQPIRQETETKNAEQPVRQETETKNEENPESQFLYPLDDSWPDSCIEFAVKTLTGELPIEDDIAIQDYFQQLDETSYTLPDLGLPNSFHTDILSDFDSKGNPVSRTQLPEIPTFLSPGNVGSMVHGDNALQQPILRGREERNHFEGKS